MQVLAEDSSYSQKWLEKGKIEQLFKMIWNLWEERYLEVVIVEVDNYLKM